MRGTNAEDRSGRGHSRPCAALNPPLPDWIPSNTPCTEFAYDGDASLPFVSHSTRAVQAMIDQLGSRTEPHQHAEGRVQGQPRRWLTPGEYIAAHGGRWHPAFPSTAPARPSPGTAGSRIVELRKLLSTMHPELGVLEAPAAYLWGEAGWLFAPCGDGVPEFTWYGADTGRMAFPPSRPSGPKLSGSILALTSDFANINFAHFLLDGLGRQGIFEQSGIRCEEIDYVYLPRLAAPHSARFIEALGLPGKNVIWARPNTYVHADRVLVTSFPGSRRDCATWLPEFWRRRVPLSQDPPFRRLYVTRGAGTRRVANESALFRQLRAHGFEFIDPASECDPARTFSQARVVVGAHGAGLANILFCRPGTRLLELIPTDHVYPHYYTLAAAGGLDYSYLAGESLGRRPKGSWGPSPFDFHIDEEELADALQQVLAD